METFDLESHLKGAYSSFPEAKHQPVIGITANYENIDATLRDRYYKQVIAAGGTPVIIPPVADSTVIVNTLEHLDGLILTGGGDHNPLWMGEEPSPRLHNINQERDAAELMLVRLAFNRQIPMLAICRGIQTLAIALGGKVYQDIKQMVKHSQDADRSEPTHSVEIKKDSTLYNIYGAEKILVNSFHHQAVSEPGKHMRIIAKSTDGIIEAIESNEYKKILGVQWHPEWLGEEGGKIFHWIVNQAINFYAAKELLDTITAAYTQPLNLHGLTDTTRVSAPFMPVRGAKIVPTKVTVTFCVDRLVEKTVQVPVQQVNFPASKQLRTFPATVNVTFQVGMGLYRSITSENFVLVVNYEELLRNKTNVCHLSLKTTPTGVSHVLISPQDVEYIIEEIPEDETDNE